MEFDHLTLQAARKAVAANLWQWGIAGEADIQLVCVSENATFRITCPDRHDCILRFHRSSYHSANEIEAEHRWINALRVNDIVQTPALLARLDGSTLGLLDLGSGQAARHAALFAAVPGIEPTPTDAELPCWFVELGGICARMHRQTETWPLPSGFQRKHWNFSTTIGETPIWGSWQKAAGLNLDGIGLLKRAVALIGQALSAYGQASKRYGLIHGDPRLANLLVDNDRLWLIDFDDCGFSWYGYDAASAVSFFEHEPHVPALLAAWMDGYRRVRPWSVEDEAILPILVMLRRIKLLGWVASHAETPTALALGSGFTEGALTMAERLLSTGTTPFAR